MHPKYVERDIIIIEVRPDCESGQDAVVYVNGYNTTLKTVYHNEDSSITFQPYNHQYPLKTYGKGVYDTKNRILGMLKEIRRKV
ncbi:MAG: S24 family peptidase [Anaerococcus sp.]|nr:S24 family peptidase [Anaerococcus sp.]